MQSDLIYLDHNAVSLVLPLVRAAINNLPDIPLNPSSVHQAGRLAKSLIEKARSAVLASVNAENDLYNLIFTSSGTESNNTIIHNFHNHLLITCKTEHQSILSAIKEQKNYQLLNVDSFGYVNLSQLEEILVNSDQDCLISIQLANNETGVIQNLKQICELGRKYNASVHSDAIQAYGKIPLDIKSLDLDLITISSNKVGGPKAVSAIIAKKNITIAGIFKGGGQERGRRAGSENLEGIVGFGEFASNIEKSIASFEQIDKVRQFIEKEIEQISPSSIIGQHSHRLPNTICITMPNKGSELQQIAFDLKGIAISTGAACSSGKISRSHVLEAMEINENKIDCAIRVSLGYNNSLEDARHFVKAWKEIFSGLNHYSGEN